MPKFYLTNNGREFLVEAVDAQLATVWWFHTELTHFMDRYLHSGRIPAIDVSHIGDIPEDIPKQLVAITIDLFGPTTTCSARGFDNDDQGWIPFSETYQTWLEMLWAIED